MKYYAVIDTNVIVSYLLTKDSNSTIYKWKKSTPLSANSEK